MFCIIIIRNACFIIYWQILFLKINILSFQYFIYNTVADAIAVSCIFLRKENGWTGVPKAGRDSPRDFIRDEGLIEIQFFVENYHLTYGSRVT